MGAAVALHVAEVHHAPPAAKRKRKRGGGSGHGEFYEYARRIYSDQRATPEMRELLLAVAYAVITAPDDGHKQWELVRKALGPSRTGRDRKRRLVEKDVPRYVSPQYQPRGWDNLLRVCSAPRLRPYRSRAWEGATAQQMAAQARRDDEDFRNVRKICGETSQEYALERLPETGWHQLHYFCPRHRDHLARVRAQVADQNKLSPQPIPNTGGLLASYFDADWETVYRHHASPNWNPPVYGLAADDWPIPGKDPVPPRARLRLIITGADLTDDETDEPS